MNVQKPNLDSDRRKNQLTFVNAVLFQIDTIMNAISLVSMSAERFGAVQHEERLTDSVGLMISHVQTLKQQRDAARRQLQFTK